MFLSSTSAKVDLLPWLWGFIPTRIPFIKYQLNSKASSLAELNRVNKIMALIWRIYIYFKLLPFCYMIVICLYNKTGSKRVLIFTLSNNYCLLFSFCPLGLGFYSEERKNLIFLSNFSNIFPLTSWNYLVLDFTSGYGISTFTLNVVAQIPGNSEQITYIMAIYILILIFVLFLTDFAVKKKILIT